MSDPFLKAPKAAKRGRKRLADEDIDSDEFDLDNEVGTKQKQPVSDEELEPQVETKTEKRRRLAKEYLREIKEQSQPAKVRESDKDTFFSQELVDYSTFDAKEMDDEIIARRLRQDATQQRGDVHKFLAEKLYFARKKTHMLKLGLRNPSGLAVCYPSLYLVLKDRRLVKFDILDLRKAPVQEKYVKMLGSVDENGEPKYHSDSVTCVAVSSDGKYVVTGGVDHNIIIWDSNRLSMLKKIGLTHRNARVNAMAFRQGTTELYVATSDLKVRVYNVAQFLLMDTLYGHQDEIADISALSGERCVTVGLRDRTALYWKIPEQTRLTFNSTVSFEKFYHQMLREHKDTLMDNEDTKARMREEYVQEGSTECVSMIDNRHFVTGLDNGALSLWSIQKKKPIYTVYKAHGEEKQEITEHSADADYEGPAPAARPRWITCVHSLPYSDIFVSGLYSGELKVWRLEKNMRRFSLLYVLRGARGVVSGISAVEGEAGLAIYAVLSKEHRLGRWVKGSGEGVYQAYIKYKAGSDKQSEKED